MKNKRNHDKKHSKLFYLVLALIMVVSALIIHLAPFGFVLLLIKGFDDLVHPAFPSKDAVVSKVHTMFPSAKLLDYEILPESGDTAEPYTLKESDKHTIRVFTFEYKELEFTVTMYRSYFNGSRVSYTTDYGDAFAEMFTPEKIGELSSDFDMEKLISVTDDEEYTVRYAYSVDSYEEISSAAAAYETILDVTDEYLPLEHTDIPFSIEFDMLAPLGEPFDGDRFYEFRIEEERYRFYRIWTHNFNMREKPSEITEKASRDYKEGVNTGWINDPYLLPETKEND